MISVFSHKITLGSEVQGANSNILPRQFPTRFQVQVAKPSLLPMQFFTRFQVRVAELKVIRTQRPLNFQVRTAERALSSRKFMLGFNVQITESELFDIHFLFPLLTESELVIQTESGEDLAIDSGTIVGIPFATGIGPSQSLHVVLED